MNYKSINEERSRLAGLLEQFRDKPLDEASRASLDRCTERIREGRFKIAVFGEFSNGKSTLLNALMELKEEILVVDELPSTAAITVLQAPPSPELERKARITFRDPARPPEVIPMEQAKSYSAKLRGMEDAAGDDRVEDEVSEVRIYLSSPLLENGVEIIDTPGLNSAYKKHTEITRRIMDQSDATIFLFDYEQAGKATEFEAIEFLSAYIRKAFLVVNKIDVTFDFRDADKRINAVCEDLRQKLEEQGVCLGDKMIYPISAKLSFQAHVRGDETLLEKSRMEDLTDALQAYLCSRDFQRDKLYTPLKKLRQDLNTVCSANRERIAAAGVSAEGLQRQLKEAELALKDEKKRMTDFTNEMKKSIRGVFRTNKSSLSDKSEAIREEILAAIEAHNTAYGIRYYQSGGGDYRQDVARGLSNAWNRTTNAILREVLQVLEEQLSEMEDGSASNLEEVSARLAQLTLESMNLGVYAPEEAFRVDFSAVDALRSEQADLQKKLSANAEKVARLKADAAQRDAARSECERLQREIADLKVSIDDMRREKAGIQNDYYQKELIREENRDGILGKIGEFFVGKRRVKEMVPVVYSGRADQERARLAQEIQEKQAAEQQLTARRDEKQEILSDGAKLDFLLDEAIQDRADMREKQLKQEMRLEAMRDEQETMQVQAYQDKMKEQVSSAVDDFIDRAAGTLDLISRRVIAYAAELTSDAGGLRRCEARRDELQKIVLASEEEREALAADMRRTNETIGRILETLSRYEAQGGERI